MAYFADLNDQIMFVLQMLESDQTLCKYLYYAENDPLSQPDIADTNILIMQNIYPLPKNPDAEQKCKAQLNVYFYTAEPYNVNSGFRKVYLCFDIICHLSVWMMKDGIRPYCISNRIDAMFNNAIVQELSNNALYFETWQHKKYSDYFYGYHLVYRLSNNSNIPCGV